ncbi:PaaI family thioesterase [Tardiphaga sp. vice352]|nr:PaaI family thioesterase [Tardiphaga sp. vice278]QDM21483.1 PaaI family thioesterase [Tardiphaga sp. vice154]QDM26670.1 PaaI family thioesterase [Tardiphaga sp. vice304]QDM31736.1 PaaI family thioesterase [Tardiphaga sp. vice352]
METDLTTFSCQSKEFSRVNVPLDATIPFHADAFTATEGEFAGWTTWKRDSFESLSGPFWHQVQPDGTVRCAFRVEARHLNGMKNVHGGCYMTFADYCLFALASRELAGPGITVSFACEFLDAAKEDELIECDGEMTRVGGSLIFLRGMLRSGERKLFSFSGTIKRVKKKVRPALAAE